MEPIVEQQPRLLHSLGKGALADRGESEVRRIERGRRRGSLGQIDLEGGHGEEAGKAIGLEHPGQPRCTDDHVGIGGLLEAAGHYPALLHGGEIEVADQLVHPFVACEVFGGIEQQAGRFGVLGAIEITELRALPAPARI